MTEDELKKRYPVGSKVKETKGNYGAPSPDVFEVIGHHRGGVILQGPKGTTHNVKGENVRRVSSRRSSLQARRGK